jgi:hypothetical protein
MSLLYEWRPKKALEKRYDQAVNFRVWTQQYYVRKMKGDT